ncbi:putative protein kinase IRE1 family [Helianthus debilis subsp. tardiflorus]
MDNHEQESGFDSDGGLYEMDCIYDGDDDKTPHRPIPNGYDDDKTPHRKPSAPIPNGSGSSERSRGKKKARSRKINKGEEPVLSVSEKEIANGSNGTVVFEGTFRGRNVAVKRIESAHSDVANREITLLMESDKHPNIIQFYGCVREGDFVYLSLERCVCNLYELVQGQIYPDLWRSDGYPSFKLLKLMRGVVAGIAHLHDLKIIYRDLKPQNIWIAQQEDLTAKLADMGISRQLASDASSLGSDATDSGTLGYQAPEQISKGRSRKQNSNGSSRKQIFNETCRMRQTRAMDMYGLGGVLLFCITSGKHPSGDESNLEFNVTNNKVDLSAVEKMPEASDLLSRLLKPNFEHRPKALEVLHHPLFWGSKKRMLFLWDTSRFFPKERRAVADALQGIRPIVFGYKWGFSVEYALIKHSQKYCKRYDYTSVLDLLRIIRNNYSHFREFSPELKELFGHVSEGVEEYYRSKFPKLLIEVYKVVYPHCKEEKWFETYLED